MTVSKINPIKGRGPNIFVRCDSIGQMLALASLGDTTGVFSHGAEERDWFGGMSFAQAKDCAVMGHEPTAKAARDLIAKFASLDIRTPKKSRVKSPYGGAFHMPSIIAGKPKPARRMKKTPSVVTPLTIIVNVSTSSGVDHDVMLKRGTAIAAMVAHLSAMRPVQFFVTVAGQWGAVSEIIAARFSTAPCNIAQLAFLLSHQSFARLIGFNAMIGAERIYNVKEDGENCNVRGVSWPFHDMTFIAGKENGDVDRAIGTKGIGSFLANELSPSNTDALYFPGMFIGSNQQVDIDRDPVQWVKDMVDKHRG